ncbi:MAG: hypothetical protein JJT88_03820 [Gammaproteobacteria bacterium]|jgi:hypothetical protein|nr:hypothetical protein [Gammaproteobacteria bacterium]
MILRFILAFLAAVLVSAALAAAASTQFVLAELARLGVEISFADRLSMTAHDVIGMGRLYLPVIGVGFLLAFGVAALVIRYLLPGWSVLGYSLAGFTAILAIILIMIVAFGLVPIAGARSIPGMLSQCLSGAVGGYLFARMLHWRRTAV